MVNKKTVTYGAIGGMTVGSVMPMLWGDYNTFGFSSVLLGMVGGFVGIFLAVWLGKQFS